MKLDWKFQGGRGGGYKPICHLDIFWNHTMKITPLPASLAPNYKWPFYVI